MSFFSDLFKGDFSNLGHDLNPSNVFSDFGSDVSKVVSNPLADLGIAAGIALPFFAPEIGAGLGAIGGDIGSALGIGGSTAAADTASLGAASADAAATDLTGEALPTSASLDSLASSGGTALGGGYVLPGTVGGTPADIVNADFNTLGAGVDTSGGAISGAGAPLNLASTATGAATSGGSAAAGAGGTGAGNFISNLTSGNIFNALQSGGADLKSIAPIAGLGGLGYNLYQGYETNQANKALTAQEQAKSQTAANISATDQAAAQPLLNSGQTLTTFLQTGTLPQAFQQQVDNQIASAKAGIIQGYASRGMSTDPTKNSALQQDLAAVDNNALTLKANLESTLATAGNQMVTTANSLLSSGLNATQLSAELPLKVAQLNEQLNQAMASSVSNFAAALNGSGVKSNLTSPQNIVSPSGGLNLG